ncbi:MAG: membrane protein insertase YidC [Flavobacteriales bacterium]|nr:membrane protein insertase YidC [Flavobacteriales bacterium]
MDRNSIIGYLLIFAIFAGYIFYTNKNLEEAREIQRVEDSIANANSRTDSLGKEVPTLRAAQSDENDSSDLSETQPDSGIAAIEKTRPESFYTLENDQLKLRLSSKGGRVAEVSLPEYRAYDSSPLMLFTPERSRFNFTLALRNRVVRTQELDFEVEDQSVNSITLIHEFPEGGAIRQIYAFAGNYQVSYRMELQDLQDKIARKDNEISLDWIVEAPRQEKDLKDERNTCTVYYKYKNSDDVEHLSETSDDEESLKGAKLHWIGFKQKFFTSAIIFPEGETEPGTELSIRQPESSEYVEQFSATVGVPYHFENKDVQEFTFYFGPNHYQTLKKLDIGIERVVPLGRGIIRWVNKFAIIPIFNWLNNYFLNYGLIILLLTLIIKGVLIFPMYKIYVSSAKMKLLKPDLDEIKEKTGGDMQKMQQEQMKLYKRAGVSPFGGCLPQLIQFPILIAMFRFFPASIELRQKAFLWAEDLSTYDSIMELGFKIPFYGDHISLFTLLMAASTFLYTMFNMQSSAAINNQMKYIMYLMPVMLLVWFNSYASGLSYYYFLANMITFGQNWVFKTFIVDDKKLHEQIQANKKKKVNVKPSKFQKRLEEMAKKRGIDPKQIRR